METTSVRIEGGALCSLTSVDEFEMPTGAGSSSAADTTGATSGSFMRAGCSAVIGIAGKGGISLPMGGSTVDVGDAVITSPTAKGDGPEGSEASAAASLAGLSAMGLGVAALLFPIGGDSIAVLSDDGLDVPLMEVESESRSGSEGLGELERVMPGILKAVEERRITVPTRPHLGFLEGGDEEMDPGGVVDMVDR